MIKISWEHVSQIVIVLGAIAVLCIGSGKEYGFIIGLLAQPAWFYTSIKNRQWGVLGATVLYTIGFTIGIYRSYG